MKWTKWSIWLRRLLVSLEPLPLPPEDGVVALSTKDEATKLMLDMPYDLPTAFRMGAENDRDLFAPAPPPRVKDIKFSLELTPGRSTDIQ